MAKSKESYQLNLLLHQVSMLRNMWNITGISYQQFADICNCSVESVKEIVNDKAPLTMRLAKKFEMNWIFPQIF